MLFVIWLIILFSALFVISSITWISYFKLIRPKTANIPGQTDYKQWLKQSQRNQSAQNNEQEIRIFQNAMLFSKVRVRDCMIPRTEVEAIDIKSSIEELRQKFISTGFSKLIVYEGSLDQILGYINSKELFKNPSSIREKLNPIAFVPETMPANRILHEFMHMHRTVAVVVDEYGGTSGIITLEDIMEEIFGEIEDEHDTNDQIERQINDHEFVLSGRLEIEYLNSKYRLDIPESNEYQTLAGYILFKRHQLPRERDVIEIKPFSFKILKASNTRIDLVYLKRTTN